MSAALRPAKHVVGVFNPAEYPFAALISRDVFWGTNLKRLHAIATASKLRRGRTPVLSPADNQAFRERLARIAPTAPFFALYHAFACRVVGPMFGGRISYTSRPTFRVHMPQTQAISLWHRDADVTGRPDQINVWFPFVDTGGTNSLWIEQHYGQGDYAPVDLHYGEFLCFDGGYLSHGSVANTTATTRVSMDFRFAPLSVADGVDLGILGARPELLTSSGGIDG